MRIKYALQAVLIVATVVLAGCPRQTPPVTLPPVTPPPNAASSCDLRRLRDIAPNNDWIRGPFTESDKQICAAACKKGERDACVGWGLVQQFGTPAGRDPVRAVTIFEEQCQQGHTPGCTHLGIAAQIGLGLLPDPERGVSLMRRACDDGDSWACVALGGWYGNGVGVEEAWVEARRWMERACNRGEQRGCASLGALLAERGESTADVRMGLDLLEKTCTAGVGHACFSLGARFHGLDATRGREYFELACKYNDMAACTALGKSFIGGTYGANDAPKGDALLEKACVAGDARACKAFLAETAMALPRLEERCAENSMPHCWLLGRLRGFSPDPHVKDVVKAAETLSKACTGGEVIACADLGQLRLSENEAEGRVLLERACRAGIGAACSNWLGLLGVSAATPAAERQARLDVAQMGCRVGDTSSCGTLGGAYLVWNVGETATMAALLEHACHQGDSIACSNLSGVLMMGQRVPRDPDRGAHFARRACNDGNPLGCHNAIVFGLLRASEKVDWAAMVHDAQRACENAEMPTCGMFANLVAFDRAQATPEMVKRFEEQCAKGDAGVCAGLSVMYVGGKGVPEDVSKAFELAKKACALGDGAACSNLGISYREGWDTPKDPEKALTYFTQSCELSYAGGCTELGRLCWDKPEGCKLRGRAFKASDLLDAVCTSGLADACEALGDGFAKEKPPNTKAEDAYQRGCNARDGATSCRKWGQWLLTAKPNQEAANAIERALLSGDADATTTAWNLFAQGWLAPRKIAETLSVGCDKGNLHACYVRGALLVQKDVPAQSPAGEKEAVQLFKKACEEGKLSKACMRFGLAQFCGRGGLVRDTKAGVTTLRKACGRRGAGAGASSGLGELQHGDPRACGVIKALEGGGINVCAR